MSCFGSDEYPAFKALNQWVIKPAVQEINEVTNYFVEVEQKRAGRKVSELKFRIRRASQVPVQESLFPDIADLPPVVIELIQAGVDRKMALNIVERQWDFVDLGRLPRPGTNSDFAVYVTQKIEISRHRKDFIGDSTQRLKAWASVS